MTTTAAVIITDALKEIGVIGEDESPSSSSLDDGLRMLNRMLETLSIYAMFSYDNPLRSLALTGQQSFDVGPTGDIVTLRPVKITSAYYTLGGIDYPVDIIDMEQYDSIAIKDSTGSVPEVLAYNGTYPDATVYVYPLCSGGTINLRTVDLVKSFPTLATQIDMPEGYEDYVMLKLAIRMAPSYGRQASPDTRLAMQSAQRSVKRNNQTSVKLTLPAVMVGGYESSLAAIYRG